MTGKALVCVLGDHIAIAGADRIVQVNMCGETIITQKSNVAGTIGLLFDCESEINSEFISAHNMFRHTELNADKVTTGFFEDSARVRPIKLKGVKCSAFFMPLDGINKEWKSADWKVGEQVDAVHGKMLCKKWVNPKVSRPQKTGNLPKQNLTPTFKEHLDTDQLERNWPKIEVKPVVVTAKLHGTSGRCGNLPIVQPRKWYHKLLGITPPNKYGLVVGSRHVVKYVEGANHRNKDKDKQSFYQQNIWYLASEKHFAGKLNKGETVFFEIVGYMPDGGEIMPGRTVNILRNFLDTPEYRVWEGHYGKNLKFSYGCAEKEFDVYVYRMTMSNDDGVSIDYTWDQVCARCQQMGVKHVPEVARVYPVVPMQDMRSWHSEIENVVECEKKGFCDIFPLTPKEGVVVRQESDGFTPKIFKSKTFEFKVLEGIIKETSTEADIEEDN